MSSKYWKRKYHLFSWKTKFARLAYVVESRNNKLIKLLPFVIRSDQFKSLCKAKNFCETEIITLATLVRELYGGTLKLSLVRHGSQWRNDFQRSQLCSLCMNSSWKYMNADFLICKIQPWSCVKTIRRDYRIQVTWTVTRLSNHNPIQLCGCDYFILGL